MVGTIDELKVRFHEVEKAAHIFDKYGFVIIVDALTERKQKILRKGVEQAVSQMLALDPLRKGTAGLTGIPLAPRPRREAWLTYRSGRGSST